MAKTIKFNLICDDKPIRTIEDLQENFSIEDVMKYYQNGLLQRWLTVRGYTEELDKVSAITSKDPIEIAKDLIQVFNVASDETDVENDIAIMKYHNAQMKKVLSYQEADKAYKKNNALYMKHFDEIIQSIQDQSTNLPYIKGQLQDIIDNYPKVFRYAYFTVIRNFFVTAPMAIFAMLTRKEFRQYLLPSEIFQGASDMDKSSVATLNEWLCNESEGNFYDADIVDKNLGKYVKIVRGETEDYWKDIEPREKKIMVIRAGSEIRIRNAGKTGQEILHDDYMKHFLILDGLDYKCNVDNHSLRYMEV